MSKISRKVVWGIFVVVIGILFGWFVFGTGGAPAERRGNSTDKNLRTEARGHEARIESSRSDRPEGWAPARSYSTMGDNGRVGRDVLERAGLGLEDGERVKAVFERAFLKVEEALGNEIRKTETVSEGTTITEVFQINGDVRVRDEAMRSLREDLIANFGNGAAKILYEGFMPNSKYEGMGGRDIMIRKRTMVVPPENSRTGSFGGDMYGKSAGDTVTTFEGQYRNGGTGEWRGAFGGGERDIRNRYGNLVSHFGL